MAGVTAPKTRALATHGTVNVFLANKNGLVVVTDSRLSDGQGGWRDGGEKLFQIDDRTVCAIAGWYGVSGPMYGDAGHQDYPAEFAVPDIFGSIISKLVEHRASPLTINAKMDLISSTFAFSLLDVVSLYEAAGASLPENLASQPPEITMAGYDENGILEVLQADLVPIIQNGKILEYMKRTKPTIYITETSGFVSIIRGIDSTANSILNGSFPLMYSEKNDPYLGYFKRALDKGEGNSLSLPQMEVFAREIERQTATQFPLYVGGEQQVAELSAGRVSQFNQPISNSTPIPKIVFQKFEGLWFKNRGSGPTFFIIVNPPTVGFVQGVKFSNGLQDLDDFFFYRSDFDHVNFIYDGSPRSIFDKSNTLTDCTLTLNYGDDSNSNFVKEIKANFPKLTIVDQTKPSKP
jgi:hypothetical protein